jgi:hypothetical protein
MDASPCVIELLLARGSNQTEAYADGIAGQCPRRPLHAERQDPMQQVAVFDAVVLGGRGEFPARVASILELLQADGDLDHKTLSARPS